MTLKGRSHLVTLGIASAVIFYWFLPEIRLASLAYNDAVNHMAIIRMMDQVWARGGNVTDFWIPHINFGHALLRSYQFLMHLVIWVMHRTVLSGMDLMTCFNACITLMAVALPWTLYRGARLLGLDRFEATAAALAAALVHEANGYGIGLTNDTFSGYGTYNQLLATVFFPLAIGYAHRAIRAPAPATDAPRPLFGACVLPGALAFSATFMSHIMTGYFACIWIALDVLAALALERRAWRPVAVSLLKAGGLILLFTGHWVIPMAADNLLQHKSHLELASKWLGPGTAILGPLLSGDVLDGGRAPVLTILGGLGLLVCATAFFARPRGGSPQSQAFARLATRRMLAAQTLAWVGLSFGPETWGPLLGALPFSGSLHWHRTFAVTQIALALCAGVMVAALWRWINPAVVTARRAGRGAAPPARLNLWAGVALCAALLFPCLWERQNYFYSVNTHWLHDTIDWWDKKELGYPSALDFALKHSDARYNVGNPYNWGAQSLVTTYIPYYGLLTQFNVENIGAIHHHQSHTEILAFRSDWQNPEQNELMNVRYIGLKPDMTPPAGYTLLLKTVNSSLYDNGNHSGYFTVGTEGPSGCADNDMLVRAVPYFLKSPLVGRHVYPGIRLARSCDGATETLENAIIAAEKQELPSSLPGRVVESGKGEAPGSDLHWVKVHMDRAGLLVFKMNYHPNWVARVDGARKPVTMIVPAFNAVRLEAGDHEVRMFYEPGPLKTALTWISALGVIGAAVSAAWAAAAAAWRRKRRS